MTNFDLRYIYDGHEFREVVQAETMGQAIDYLKWIYEDDIYCFITSLSHTTDEIASYFCPAGWTRPESREAAMRRSLYESMALAGINPNIHNEAMDKFFDDMGYNATRRSNNAVFDMFKQDEIVYTKPHAADFVVPVYEEVTK